jgi:hypothetical protein
VSRRAQARAAAAARERARRRAAAIAALIVVVVGAALAERARRRRARGSALAVAREQPRAARGARGGQVARPMLTQLPAGAAFTHAPIIAASDDLDDAGAGLPIPPEEAALERRVETRSEAWILVRCVVILLFIAVALTARALFVH